MNTFRSIKVADMAIAAVTRTELVEHVIERASNGQGGWVITPNSDIARQAFESRRIMALVNEADIRVADGMPLIWASRILGTPLPERVCGSDLVWHLTAEAANKRLAIFLLGGGEPQTARNASLRLQAAYPNAMFCGTYFPPFGFEKKTEEIRRIKNVIRDANPDIVYVALGFPKAEQLISELRKYFPQTWWVGVGISLSLVAGEIKRAPSIAQTLGLEWVFRLAQEPRRLAKRYLWHDVPFVTRLLISAIFSRLRKRAV